MMRIPTSPLGGISWKTMNWRNCDIASANAKINDKKRVIKRVRYTLQNAFNAYSRRRFLAFGTWIEIVRVLKITDYIKSLYVMKRLRL